MKAAVVALTAGGNRLADKIVAETDSSQLLDRGQSVAATLAANWHHFDAFICIMATGIVVRAIAPLLQDKYSDPCIIVMDEKGSHVISLLSGHLGGGNQLARALAQITGGRAVITTASDTLNLVALDLWARDQNLAVEDRAMLTWASSLLVNQGSLKIFSDVEVDSLPPGLILTPHRQDAAVIISSTRASYRANSRANYMAAVLRPRNLIVGVGCNRGTPVGEFEEALAELLAELDLSPLAIRNLASIDAKNDEAGLLRFAEDNGWPIAFFRREQINALTGITVSPAAVKAVGAIAVAEPTALLSANTNILLSRKRKWQNITMAIAQAPFMLSAQARGPSST